MLNQILKDERFREFFQYFGLFVFSYAVVKAILKIANNLGTFYLGTGAVNLKKYGSWAVITGCTDGIGKAYTEKLSKKGLNVVLISRSKDKLEAQAKEIEQKFSVQTKIIAADFTEPISIYDNIKKQLSGLEIAILVNNVGIGYQYPEYFEKFAESMKNVDDMINCNILSVTKMTAIVLPGMVQRKGGVIINNASASGRIPTPLLTVYSATKSYVDFFSRALNIEYTSKGIIVQSLCPYFVSTKLAGVRKAFTIPTPDEFVSSAMNTISTQLVTNGCLIHNIQGWAYENFIPRFIFDKLSLNILIDARKRALKKIEKQKASAAKLE